MAGKQKYGRGISLGLLDIDAGSLARELKSDPDTSIGDEIRRIILTKTETYALIACTEHGTTYTCFVIFKLDPINSSDEKIVSTSNCTMLLTRFDTDPNNTFSINDKKMANTEEYMLTVLRKNEVILWKLNDGEISHNYEFNYLNNENKVLEILNCQFNDANRLIMLLEQGSIYIWDVTLMLGQFSLITTISDPLVS